MGKLDNRVAVVTGAAQGIGKAVADKLESEGATVVGADVQSGTTMQVDVSKEEDVKRMVEDTVAEHGHLDVLVNVAAIVPFTPWDEVDFAERRPFRAFVRSTEVLSGLAVCAAGERNKRPLRRSRVGASR